MKAGVLAPVLYCNKYQHLFNGLDALQFTAGQAVNCNLSALEFTFRTKSASRMDERLA